MFVTDSLCVEAVTLWDLCNALWGSVMPDDALTSETNYACQLARREAVSQWLTSCSATHINTEIQSADIMVVCLFLCVFQKITMHFVFVRICHGYQLCGS